MSSQDYPFSLINAFFVDLKFKRLPETTPANELPLIAEVKVVENASPDRLQANLRLRAAPQKDIEFFTEVIGLFNIENEDARRNKALQVEFLENRGIFILWAYTAQMIRMITGQMGINSLNIAMPLKIELQGMDTEVIAGERE